MSFIPLDRHKTLSRWGLPVLTGFACCMGLLGAQNTLKVWDDMSDRQTSTRMSLQAKQLQTKKEIAQIEQQATLSDVHQQAKILDYSCGTTLNNFKYQPGQIDDDLIQWGLDPKDPIFNPVPGRWFPLYAQSGHLVAAVRNGSVISIDTLPDMDAGQMCSYGQLR